MLLSLPHSLPLTLKVNKSEASREGRYVYMSVHPKLLVSGRVYTELLSERRGRSRTGRALRLFSGGRNAGGTEGVNSGALSASALRRSRECCASILFLHPI